MVFVLADDGKRASIRSISDIRRTTESHGMEVAASASNATNVDKVAQPESDSNPERDEPDDLPPPYSFCAWAAADVVFSAEKERLRRFLSHCLSLDYDLRKNCPDKLRREDWYHFVWLSKLSCDVHKEHHPATATRSILLNWSDSCCHHAEIEGYIKKPAEALGIETRVVVGMLWGFVWRHAYCPTPLSDGAGFFMEYMLGPRFFAEKLVRDKRLFKILIPPTATKYLSLIRWKNQTVIPIHFNILNSSSEYELKVAEQERSEDPEEQRRIARLLESEHSTMNSRHDSIAYMGAAMQGFPCVPNPSWWKRTVVKWWAGRCARDLFGDE